MVDVVGLREFENGRCGIDCLKHMHSEALALQLQGLGPISQCYQTVDVLAVSLLVEGLVQCNSAKLEHIETSQACRRKRRKNALRRYAKLVVEGSWTLRKVDRDDQDWRGGKLGSKRGLSARPRQVAIEPPAQDAAQWIDLQPLRSGGELDLVRMAQIESELRRRRITPGGFDLKPSQHDFLQPCRIVGLQPARWNGIAPKPPAHPVHRLALTERPHARGKEIKQHTQGEQIASRVMAYSEQPFRRHIGSGPERQAKFLLHQIGQLIVTGEAVVKQHGISRRPE